MDYPEITLRANWMSAYDSITFTVEGLPYCDVLIDRRLNTLVYPNKDPVPTDDNSMFLGWDREAGSYLSGIVDDSKIVCGRDGEPIVCGTSSGPIVCYDETGSSYNITINAYIASKLDVLFDVKFIYHKSEDEKESTTIQVE